MNPKMTRQDHAGERLLPTQSLRRAGQSVGNRTAAVACLLLLTFSAEPSSKGADAANGRDPAYVHVHDADKAMDDAVHKAQQTFTKFVEALTRSKPGQTGFSLKKRCTKGDKCEHLWIKNVHFDGRDMRGQVDNAPLELKSPRLGDEVTVQPEEITDWMFVENGKMVGGYTLLVYYNRLSAAEKKAFSSSVGFQIK